MSTEQPEQPQPQQANLPQVFVVDADLSKIMTLRGQNKSFREIGKEMNMSHEYIRQKLLTAKDTLGSLVSFFVLGVPLMWVIAPPAPLLKELGLLGGFIVLQKNLEVMGNLLRDFEAELKAQSEGQGEGKGYGARGYGARGTLTIEGY